MGKALDSVDCGSLLSGYWTFRGKFVYYGFFFYDMAFNGRTKFYRLWEVIEILKI